MVHKKTYKCLIADKCDKKWGWLYMNGKGIQMSKCGERGQRMVHVLHELKMHRNIQMRVNGPGGWLISGYSLWCRSCIIAIYGRYCLAYMLFLAQKHSFQKFTVVTIECHRELTAECV